MSMWGEDAEFGQRSLLNDQQQKMQKQDINNTLKLGGKGGGYQNAMSLLESYMNPESDVYKNFEQPYLNEFNEKTIPQLAEQFGGANAMGSGLMTSGFGQSLGAAGGNLQAQLAQMKEQYRRQSINDLLQQYNTASGRGQQITSENYMTPATEGWGTPLIKAGLTAAGTAIGGPMGGIAANMLSGMMMPGPPGAGNGGNQPNGQAFTIGAGS